VSDADFTELVSERIVLRRFRLADLSALVAYRSIPEVARFQGWDAPFSSAEGEDLIGGMMSQHPDTAKTLAEDSRQAEIGYTLAPAHQGRGYATEAARTLLRYLFQARGKHRVIAYCDVRNAPSARVLQRLGMRREGHLIESTWWKGEWTDELLYAMLDREWSQRR
jgi:RimJ/RimL family protein N-acetyltransferase